MKLFKSIEQWISAFLKEHTTVKSAWRYVLYVTAVAVADHYGVLDVIKEILQTTGA